MALFNTDFLLRPNAISLNISETDTKLMDLPKVSQADMSNTVMVMF